MLDEKNVLIALLVGFFLFPVHFFGGATGAASRSAPDEHGYSYYSYVVEPLSIYLIESVRRKNIKIYYYRGSVKERIPGYY